MEEHPSSHCTGLPTPGYGVDMSRPKDADAEETRRRILQCACDLLADPNQSFSLRAVASKADISVGALQYHFADKRTLMDACIDTVYDTFTQLGPTLASRLASADDVNELIERAIRFTFTYARQNRSILRVLETSVIQEGGLDPERHRATERPFIESIGKLVDATSTMSPQEARLRLNSLIVVGARYAIMEESAIAAIMPPAEGKSTLDLVTEHLVSLALQLLSPNPPPNRTS